MPTVPAPVLAWLVAVAAGVAETAVRLAAPNPPRPSELLGRGLVYLVVVAVVLALGTGRDAVRWLLAVVLGGVGTLSLVVEPITWWVDGGSPAAFLVGAPIPSLVAAVLRAAHVVAVVAGVALMFGPRANAFFRAGESGRSGTTDGRTGRERRSPVARRGRA